MKQILFTLTFLSFSLCLLGETLQVGNEFKLLEYETQKDEKVSIPQQTKTLVFTSEMEASKIAHEVFEKLGDEYLKQNSIVFVSDIHRMPFLITKFVALPKMRSYNYTIHLIKEEGISKDIPKEKGKLTVISLDNYKITSIQFATSPEELQKLLGISSK